MEAGSSMHGAVLKEEPLLNPVRASDPNGLSAHLPGSLARSSWNRTVEIDPTFSRSRRSSAERDSFLRDSVRDTASLYEDDDFLPEELERDLLVQRMSARSHFWRKLQDETPWERALRCLSIALALLAICSIPLAAVMGKLGQPWCSADWLCYVSPEGVICNNSIIPLEEHDEGKLDERVGVPDAASYVRAFLFLLITGLSVGFRRWREQRAQGVVYRQPGQERGHELPAAESACVRGAPLAWKQLALVGTWMDWMQPALTGLLTGAAMAFYQLILQDVMTSVWGSPLVTLGEPLARHTSPWAVLLIPPLLLCCSGLLQAFLQSGAAGSFVGAVNRNLRIDPFKGLIATSVVSIVAIASGGSAGPEGPVLFIGAAVGVITRLPRGFGGSSVQAAVEAGACIAVGAGDVANDDGSSGGRPLGDDALIGGCAAIAAFFDHPISGCLFVMELPHMHGSVHKGVVLAPALVASCFSWLAHRLLMPSLEIMPPPVFPAVSASPAHLLLAVPCGIITGGLAYAFIRLRRVLDALPFNVWVRGLVLGGVVGLIGLCMPDTLTWGEDQIDLIANHRQPLDVRASTALAAAKFCAIILTTASGYGAGIVYPLMYVGYALGPLVAMVLSPSGLAPPPSSFAQHAVRDPGVELIGQALGSGFLAGTMRAPVGSAILVAFMGREGVSHAREPTFLCLLLLTNLGAVYVNKLSAIGQK